MDAKQSIEIAAPPERVWPLLVEPGDVLDWWTTLTRFEYEDGGQRGLGARIYAEEKASGQLLKLHFMVTELEENRQVALHMVSATGPVKGYDLAMTLEPLAAGSRFTFEEHVELPYGALGKVLGRLGRGSSMRHLEEALAKLKTLAEAPPG